MDREVSRAADRWWARDFACAPDELRPPTTRVQAHAGSMVGAEGIWILVVGPHPLVSLPDAAMERVAGQASQWSNALVADAPALASELESLKVTKIVGPAFIGYGTADTLDLARADGARALTPADDAAVAGLRGACGEVEWDHGGSDHRAVPTFGCFSPRGDLLSLSGYKTWGEEIAHIAIVTASHERGSGLASTAVACAARHAIGAGLVPQYRTLAANEPSMRVARRLGFEGYGFSVFVRLDMG